MENVNRYSPQERKELGLTPEHRFEIRHEGKRTGYAKVKYFSKPLPHYNVSYLHIREEERGKGYGSQILGEIEAWLNERSKPGVLADAIAHDSPARGMYQRRGWLEVPNEPGLFVYNWPEKTDISLMDAYDYRYTDSLERKGVKPDDILVTDSSVEEE